jgi:hypothetical protein
MPAGVPITTEKDKAVGVFRQELGGEPVAEDHRDAPPPAARTAAGNGLMFGHCHTALHQSFPRLAGRQGWAISIGNGRHSSLDGQTPHQV